MNGLAGGRLKLKHAAIGGAALAAATLYSGPAARASHGENSRPMNPHGRAAGPRIGPQAPPALQTAGSLMVWLDARDPSAGSSRWVNRGSLGPFESIGSPQLRQVHGMQAVVFGGMRDAYRGPAAVPSLEGDSPRSIEVWVYAAGVREAEQTMVAWGRRGGPTGADMSFNYGRSESYGAATHWADDLGWNGLPAPGEWHYLVYTFDGTTARVYDNTSEKNSLQIRLRTAPESPINIGVQNGQNGGLQFSNEYDGSPMSANLAIAEVRVETGALTPAQIAANFAAEAARFGAVRLKTAQDTLLAAGIKSLKSSAFTLDVSSSTQQALSLRPIGSRFDFLPADRLNRRAFDGFYQLGDIEFGARVPGGAWRFYNTADRHVPVKGQVSSSSISAGLNAELAADCPLEARRSWRVAHGDLVMRFQLRNRTHGNVELGAFGAAMVFNNILTRRTLNEAHENCSFADPYIGGDAGYLQVTRLNGKPPVLLVLPEAGSGMEAYRPLHADRTPRDVTFEGFYEWTVLSKAYAEGPWKGAEEWN
ncbi:MAG TPA: DUF5695 domain-containing protein, partial [Chthonomonadales bacterium]|nr:DUF5695 domain-containing protein [Chthonomonadales bacterium]